MSVHERKRAILTAVKAEFESTAAMLHQQFESLEARWRAEPDSSVTILKVFGLRARLLSIERILQHIEDDLGRL